LEAVLGYRGLRHGEAVAYGLLFALRLAASPARPDPLPEADASRLRALLARLELPELPRLDPAALLFAMSRDKKARESGLVWVLPARLGQGRTVADIGDEEVRRELEAFLRDPWA
jgi:3-dehydroquinate synthase